MMPGSVCARRSEPPLPQEVQEQMSPLVINVTAPLFIVANVGSGSHAPGSAGEAMEGVLNEAEELRRLMKERP